MMRLPVCIGFVVGQMREEGGYVSGGAGKGGWLLVVFRGWRLEVGGWRLEVGGWRLEVRGWRLEVGGWRFEVGGSRFEDGSSRFEGLDCDFSEI
jgi:hypothetical protein